MQESHLKNPWQMVNRSDHWATLPLLMGSGDLSSPFYKILVLTRYASCWILGFYVCNYGLCVLLLSSHDFTQNHSNPAPGLVLLALLVARQSGGLKTTSAFSDWEMYSPVFFSLSSSPEGWTNKGRPHWFAEESLPPLLDLQKHLYFRKPLSPEFCKQK